MGEEMDVRTTFCDYCAEPPRDFRDGNTKFKAVSVEGRPEVTRDQVCDNCRERVEEFIKGSLINHTKLAELETRGVRR